MRPPAHPDLSDWVDYARGLGDPPIRTERAAHLEACPTCRRLAARFLQVAELARLEPMLTPSPAALRLAESIAAQVSPDPVLSLPRLLARLLSGGAPAPALAGLRSAGPGVREGRYQAGPYALRLRVERDRGSSDVSIVGQIDAPEADAPGGVARLPVLVTSGWHVVARTDTNIYGEFVLACDPSPRLRLQVAVEASARRVDVPLAPLLPGRPAR